MLTISIELDEHAALRLGLVSRFHGFERNFSLQLQRVEKRDSVHCMRMQMQKEKKVDGETG
jgi:hypothetical protein